MIELKESETQVKVGPAVAILEISPPTEQEYLAGGLEMPVASDEAQVDWFLVLNQLAEFEASPTVVMTGDDPLGRADLFDLVKHARGLGLETVLRLPATENATGAAIHELKRAGLNRVALRIESRKGDAHDRIVGESGSFERTMRMISDSHAWWLPVEIHTTITHGNIDEIDAIAEFLAPHEIQSWWVHFLVPPAGVSMDDCPRPYEFETAFESLWLNSIHQEYEIDITDAPHYRRYVMDREGRGPIPGEGSVWAPFYRARLALNDGKGVLFVSNTGCIYPGEFLPVYCGKFPQDSVVDVYKNSPTFQALRDPEALHGRCHDCDYNEVCGGSRARAFAATGDMLASDPGCYNVAYGKEAPTQIPIARQ